MSALDELLTMEEAAEIASRAPNTMRSAAARGTLRARRFGRAPHDLWITDRQAVSEYLAYVASAAWHRQPQVMRQRRRAFDPRD